MAAMFFDGEAVTASWSHLGRWFEVSCKNSKTVPSLKLFLVFMIKNYRESIVSSFDFINND